MGAYRFEYEADWKIFQKLVTPWIERYFQKKNESYIRMLRSEGRARDKWWKLKDLMKNDIKVIESGTDMSRSCLIDDLSILAANGIITVDELEKFTPKMQDQVIRFLGRLKEDSPGGRLVNEWNGRHGEKRVKVTID